MTKKQKKAMIRIIIAVVLVGLISLLPVKGYIRFALFMIPYLVIGYDILRKAVKGIMNRQVFDENFLMAVATIGAIALGDYTEGVAVMIFYQIGELFQSYAVGKSRRNISELMDIRPDYANVETENGELEQVDPDEVEIGSVIVVQPGEKVPIDGVIIEGKSTLNTSALTGESLPREAEVDDEIVSGCINMTGVLRIKTTKEFGESTVSKILDMVENASSRKSRSENFISKFAPLLYTGRMLLCGGTGSASSVSKYSVFAYCAGLGRVDLPCIDISGYQLSVCAGYQYSSQFLCGNRWGKPFRCTGKGLQLYGDTGTDQLCCI